MAKVAPDAPRSRKRKREDDEPRPDPRTILRIGDLPDELMGAVVSRLPFREGARTRWRNMWSGHAPLNLDCTDLGHGAFDIGDQTVSRILSRHQGPARRFTLRASCADPRPTAAMVDAWLRSPALRDLRQLQFRFDKRRLPPSQQPPDADAMVLEPLPQAVLRFADTLHILDLVSYRFVDAVKATPFMKIQYLTLENVSISQQLLDVMFKESQTLQGIMLSCIIGITTVHINSSNIRCVAVHVGPRNQQRPPLPPANRLVVQHCPHLKRLMVLDDRHALHTTIFDAPVLESIGYLSDGHRIHSGPSSSFTVTDSLSIQCVTGGRENRWEKKHKDFAISMSLRVVAVSEYRGTDTQSRFASFILQKAGGLQLMVLGVSEQNNTLEFRNMQLNNICYSKRISVSALVRFQALKYRVFQYTAQFRSANDIDYPDPFMYRS